MKNMTILICVTCIYQLLFLSFIQLNHKTMVRVRGLVIHAIFNNTDISVTL